MLLAYIDEIGEPGPYVAKDHKRFNTSPVFGYAGFVLPEDAARSFGKIFTEEKRRLFAGELHKIEHPGRWERKGSDIFTPDAWSKYSRQIRVVRGLITQLADRGGEIFYYADQKEKGTRNQVRLTDEEREKQAMQETVNRLCRFAERHKQNLLILMDQINEKQRAARVASIYAHIFSREEDFPEMAKIVEPPMHVDSALSANIQFADWIAAAVSRAVDYQLEENSRYSWIPRALGAYMHRRITNESKLRLWRSSLDDLHHFAIFRRERPVIERLARKTLSDDDLERLRLVKHSAAKRAGD